MAGKLFRIRFKNKKLNALQRELYVLIYSLTVNLLYHSLIIWKVKRCVFLSRGIFINRNTQYFLPLFLKFIDILVLINIFERIVIKMVLVSSFYQFLSSISFPAFFLSPKCLASVPPATRADHPFASTITFFPC